MPFLQIPPHIVGIPFAEVPLIQGVLFWLKVASAIISVLLAVGLVWVVRRSRLLSHAAEVVEDYFAAPIPHDRIAERWEGIERALGSSHANDWKLAVIDADRLLETTLQYLALPGETLGDKLKEFDRSELSVIDEVWDAHRLRNTLVHGEGTEPSLDRARAAVRAIGAALRELGALS